MPQWAKPPQLIGIADTAQIMLPCGNAGSTGLTWHSLTLRLHAAVVYTTEPAAHYKLYERVGTESEWLVRDGLDSESIRQGRRGCMRRARIPHSHWSALSYVVVHDSIVPSPTGEIVTIIESDNLNGGPPEDTNRDRGAPLKTAGASSSRIARSEPETQGAIARHQDIGGDGCNDSGGDGDDGAGGTKRGARGSDTSEEAREDTRREEHVPRREHMSGRKRGADNNMVTARRGRGEGDGTRTKIQRCEADGDTPPFKRLRSERRQAAADCRSHADRKRKRSVSPITRRQRVTTPSTSAEAEASRSLLPEPEQRPMGRPPPFRDKHALRVSLRHVRNIHHGRSITAPRETTSRNTPPLS